MLSLKNLQNTEKYDLAQNSICWDELTIFNNYNSSYSLVKKIKNMPLFFFKNKKNYFKKKTNFFSIKKIKFLTLKTVKKKTTYYYTKYSKLLLTNTFATFLKKKNEKNSFFFWNYIIFATITKQYFNFQSDWNFYNVKNIKVHPKIAVFKKKFLKVRILKHILKNKMFFEYLFFQLIFFKDCNYLIKFLVLYLTKSKLKQHRLIFFRVARFFKFWFQNLKMINNLQGYAIFFKGKLGRKGSVRKTKFFKKDGKATFSCKQIRVNFKTFQFVTNSGVVGGGLSLFFIDYAHILFIIFNVLYYDVGFFF